jgi:hypothetical protein
VEQNFRQRPPQSSEESKGNDERRFTKGSQSVGLLNELSDSGRTTWKFHDQADQADLLAEIESGIMIRKAQQRSTALDSENSRKSSHAKPQQQRCHAAQQRAAS